MRRTRGKEGFHMTGVGPEDRRGTKGQEREGPKDRRGTTGQERDQRAEGGLQGQHQQLGRRTASTVGHKDSINSWAEGKHKKLDRRTVSTVG